MAKKCKIAKNARQLVLIARHRERRAELKKIIRDINRPVEERIAAEKSLRKLPRDSSPTRYRNRCALTGRPRGYYRRFGLSRIKMREYALKGELPGLTKSSW